MATELENGDWQDGNPVDVSCVHEDGPRYTCMGDFVASRVAVEAMFSEGEVDFDGQPIGYDSWKQVQDENTQAMSWKVTIGDDGKWIARAEL